MKRTYTFRGATLHADIEKVYPHIIARGEMTADEIWEWECEGLRNRVMGSEVERALARGEEVDIVTGMTV